MNFVAHVLSHKQLSSCECLAILMEMQPEVSVNSLRSSEMLLKHFPEKAVQGFPWPFLDRFFLVTDFFCLWVFEADCLHTDSLFQFATYSVRQLASLPYLEYILVLPTWSEAISLYIALVILLSNRLLSNSSTDASSDRNDCSILVFGVFFFKFRELGQKSTLQHIVYFKD